MVWICSGSLIFDVKSNISVAQGTNRAYPAKWGADFFEQYAEALFHGIEITKSKMPAAIIHLSKLFI